MLQQYTIPSLRAIFLLHTETSSCGPTNEEEWFLIRPQKHLTQMITELCSLLQLVPAHLVLIHLQFHFIFYNLHVIIPVLVVKHVLNDAVGIGPWPKPTFALFNLELDEG